MLKMKYYFAISFAIICVYSIRSCGSSTPTVSKGSHLVTVEAHAPGNSLFYAGTIQPLKTVVVPSPADGVIVDMPFQYGEPVKAGQLLYMLSSTKFLSDYKTALLQYVKAKSEFNNSESLMKEGEFLHKNQLISDDDFKMKQTNYYAAQLAFVQAKDSLESLIHQLDMKDVNLYKLTIADIDKITKAMHMQMSSEHLRVIAPSAGIILSPSKNEEEIKKLIKGDQIKQGDVLAVIGDMSGIAVRIKVNELTVNQLKVGQKVKITGIAFPEDILQGQIKRVDRQGEIANGGLPMFLVEVMVPKLTEKQQHDIHAGMSAKIEISVDESAQVMIPIMAIKEKSGQTFVSVFDEQKKTTNDVLVKAGKTTIDSVAILSGVKPGDRIVVPN
jgi:multidrug efflux pump subunit AcrA (membrane-fusion protein)